MVKNLIEVLEIEATPSFLGYPSSTYVTQDIVWIGRNLGQKTMWLREQEFCTFKFQVSEACLACCNPSPRL